jgi:hypothetical protein
MNEQRYSEEEAAEIFRKASESEQGTHGRVASLQGMTLAELQEIGREAGLDPELIARAALAREVRGGITTRVLGLPLGVGRTLELDRPLGEHEWESLVSDLRATFGARGRLSYDGPFRQWSNGNLQVLVEPTPRGHRIRFSTLNGSSRSLLASGAALIGLGALVGVVAALGGEGRMFAGSVVALVTSGGALAALGAARLPRWVRTRLRQMDQLITRVKGA